METLEGKVVLVTGATDGIGLATAKLFSRAGAKLVLHGRNEERLRSTAGALERDGRRPETVLADFASLRAVDRMVAEVTARFPALDVLINNAGIGGGPTGGQVRQVSRDGYELRFAVNYLAPFALTLGLLPVLEKSPVATVVNVSSIGQAPIDFDDVMLERRYDGGRAYCQSKLAQILFTFELAGRTRDRIAVNSLHPGTLLDTKMVREAYAPLGHVETGAEAIANLARLGLSRKATGAYFDVTREARANEQAYDDAARARLWALSEQLCRDALQRQG